MRVFVLAETKAEVKGDGKVDAKGQLLFAYAAARALLPTGSCVPSEECPHT
jgi:hypothetical protein